MKLTKYGIVALALAIALLCGGCKNTAPSGPVAGLGGATVSKYVSVGNSLTAGYQSNALFASAQAYSYPNLISKQLSRSGAAIGTFQQPLWGDPGSPDANGNEARYELISWNGPVIGPRLVPAGPPPTLQRSVPWDNLGVPGSVVGDFLDPTPFAAKAVARKNPFFLYVLGADTTRGKTILAQTIRLNPDLVTFWLGNNDVLGFATSGGVFPPTYAPTSVTDFTTYYTGSISFLRAALPNAKIVVGNIPDVRAIPFFNTVGPKIAASLPAGVYLRYQMHGNTSVAFDSTRFTEANPPLICLTGSPYASLLGHPTGRWYTDHAYSALPPGIDTTKPFGLHPQNPWPDALVLDLGEQATAGTAVTNFNGIIASVASGNKAIVVDMNAFFNGVKANGYRTSGLVFTADYISGGLFSFDGVHPSDQGAGVIANQFILAMNRGYGWSVPLVDVSALPSLTVPLSKGARLSPEIPAGAFGDLEMLWGGGR